MSRKMQKFVDLLEGKTAAFGRPAGERRNARWMTDLRQGSLIPQKHWALGRPDFRSGGEYG